MNRRPFRERINNNKNLQIFLVACGAILFYILLNHLGVVWNGIKFILGILAPVIIAALIAFLLNPVVQFLETKVFRKLKIRSGRYLHGFCVILVVLVIVVLLLVLLYVVISQVATSATHLLSHFDSYLQAFVDMLNRYLSDQVSELNVFGVDLLNIGSSGLQEFIGSIVAWISGHTEGIIGGAMSIGSNLLNILLTVMLTLYMLLDVHHLTNSLKRFFRSIMEPDRYIRFADICARSSGIFLRYFGSNLLDSLIIGVLCYFFMIILNLPYAVLIAVVVGVCNFIPTFGPIVGAIIGAFLILIVNPWGALWFIIYSIVSQFCDANLIKPKLFGDTTGLRPMWVLASIIICGGLFGVIGMLLGVPFFAIFAIIINERMDKRLQRWDYVKEDTETAQQE
ncbi:MAG: AI-2E family transporter [Parasporobacterium sp.]|nr:AI-2E family transporter [Parasporobacterium sp.]MBQ9033020.1 AI-2E family transporter [Parasporobacterium sp.]